MYRFEEEDGMLRMIATEDFDTIKAGDKGGLVHPGTVLGYGCWVHQGVTVGPHVQLRHTIVHADLTVGWFNNCIVKTPVKYDSLYSDVTLEGEQHIFKLPIWDVIMFEGLIKIGCQQHSPEQWVGFTDAEINDMSLNALDWWREHKAFVLRQYELNYSPNPEFRQPHNPWSRNR